MINIFNFCLYQFFLSLFDILQTVYLSHEHDKKKYNLNSIKNAVQSIVGCVFELTRMLLHSTACIFPGKIFWSFHVAIIPRIFSRKLALQRSVLNIRACYLLYHYIRVIYLQKSDTENRKYYRALLLDLDCVPKFHNRQRYLTKKIYLLETFVAIFLSWKTNQLVVIVKNFCKILNYTREHSTAH